MANLNLLTKLMNDHFVQDPLILMFLLLLCLFLHLTWKFRFGDTKVGNQ